MEEDKINGEKKKDSHKSINNMGEDKNHDLNKR